jgi:hypothetical protein
MTRSEFELRRLTWAAWELAQYCRDMMHKADEHNRRHTADYYNVGWREGKCEAYETIAVMLLQAINDAPDD